MSYNPEAVRLDLFLRHREVERLELLAAASQEVADRLTEEDAALRRRLQAQDAELDRLRAERERLLSDLEALRHHLQAEDAELDRLRRHLQAKDTELDILRAQLAAREATIAKVLASRSWKLTAPLRAADRLLRGSPESS